MLGQQSLAEYLGLHVDIKRIQADNKSKPGVRKHGLLVNDGDKLTREDLEQKRQLNEEKYGLSDEQIKMIRLPAPTAVCFYSVKKLMNPKNELSTIERIEKLLDLERALAAKLVRIQDEKITRKSSLNKQP